jgi:hypothetical protein
MEIDRTFIVMVIGFGLLGGLTLLSHSSCVIKLHKKQMEFLEAEKKRKEQQEAAKLAAIEAKAAREKEQQALITHSKKSA